MEPANEDLAHDIPHFLISGLETLIGHAMLLPPSDCFLRCNTIEYIEFVVLDIDGLAEHFGLLASFPEVAVTVDDSELCDLVDTAMISMAALSNRQLIALLVDPVALAKLRVAMHEREECDSDAWLDAYAKLGERGIKDGCVPKAASQYAGAIQRPLGQFEVYQGRASLGSSQFIYDTFSKRREIESDSIACFGDLPEDEQDSMCKKLKLIQERLFRAEGDEFAALDVEFHILLSSLSDDAGYSRELAQFVFEHGDREALTLQTRTRVWFEHAAVLNALCIRDINKAAAASRTHMNASRQRWLPRVDLALLKGDIEFFDRLAGSDKSFVCVSSLNIQPVELDPRFRNSVGTAAANAIGRGTSMMYLRPSQKLLNRWKTERGMTELRVTSERDTDSDFRDFRDFAIRHIAEHYLISVVEATAKVDSHLIQLNVSEDELFMFTRPNSTVGYFCYGDGQTQLTYRAELADSEAWLGISPMPGTSLMKGAFLDVAHRSVTNWLRDPDSECDDVRANRSERVRFLADKWLRKPSLIPAIHR
ncbi:FCD domain-containing protein [Anatilimnocola sp. NA78]|uniref:FCD domain-containing protein n=1 Tax=Anatilimnocola sp. NA78 TaxID=3415683 RepID=UPI003CE56EB6